MSEEKKAWTRPLLLLKRKRSLGSRQLKRLLRWARNLLRPKKKPRRLHSRLLRRTSAEEDRQAARTSPRRRPPSTSPERAAAPVPAPVAAAEEPVEPLPTPAAMRVMRQLSRADRFEELLTRNTMEF